MKKSEWVKREKKLVGELRGKLSALADKIVMSPAELKKFAIRYRNSRFHPYSLLNTLWMIQQCPDFTVAAGENKWKEMGRTRKTGERKLEIFAPIFGYYKQKVTDPKTGLTTEETVKYPKDWKRVYVLDVSQTEGDPIDIDAASDLHGKAEFSLEFFEKNAMTTVTRTRGMIEDGFTDGYSSIVIAERPDENAMIASLLHRQAHMILHGDKPEEGSDRAREIREFEAEATAYLVASVFGVDSEDRSAKFIGMYSGSPDDLKDRGAKVIDAAERLVKHYMAFAFGPAVTKTKEELIEEALRDEVA